MFGILFAAKLYSELYQYFNAIWHFSGRIWYFISLSSEICEHSWKSIFGFVEVLLSDKVRKNVTRDIEKCFHRFVQGDR